MESHHLGMTVFNSTTNTTAIAATALLPAVAAGANVALTPILPAMEMFQRCKHYIAGSLVEDIDNCGTLTGILGRLQSSARRYSDAMESGHAMPWSVAEDVEHFNIDDEALTPIAAGAARRTITKLPFGLLAQDK